jgi:ABC-2 type transport system ATP-binding protein
MGVIEIEGLHKEYAKLRGGRTVAIQGLDLSVPTGGVFGFLGPNGAGKTTTIRCLLGLVRPSAGRMTLMGADVQRDLPSVIARVGSIVEAPAMFPRFSGRRNLEILARIHGEGETAIDAALERVGLTDRAKDRVRTYSLGMKQRRRRGHALRDPRCGSGRAAAGWSAGMWRCASSCGPSAPRDERSSSRATSCPRCNSRRHARDRGEGR